MSVQAISWVLDHSTSKGAIRLVLISIANHVNPDGSGWVHVKRVCREANVSPDTYHRAVTWAIETGELERQVNQGGDLKLPADKRPNRFQFSQIRGPQDAHPESGRGPQDAEVRGPQDENPAGSAGCPPIAVLVEPSVEPSENRASFDEFWSVYPCKRGKGQARPAFVRACRKVDPAVIVEGARRYASDPNLPLDDPRFIAHATTWLNGERWGDGPLPPRTGNGSNRSNTTKTAIGRFLTQEGEPIEARTDRDGIGSSRRGLPSADRG